MFHPFMLLLLLWSCWVILAWASAWKVRKFLGLYRRPRRTGYDIYRPRAHVVVPFKGVDTDLASGVRGLCTQDYSDYRLLLVVDSADDPAYPVLERELAKYPGLGRIIVAGAAGPNEGQKIHNQLAAIDVLETSSADSEAWVFADSDAVPGPNWLGDLVGALATPKITGLTTGYRWLIPVEGAPIWTDLASVINSSVACQLGKDALNYAWGGSMAVMAGLARKGGLRGRLVGALCDDYQFTRMSTDEGLRTYFVPRCLVATPANFNWAGLINFGHRQYLLTRVYAPGLFLTALALTSLYVVSWLSAWVVLIAGAIGIWRPQFWYASAAALLLAMLANQVRATLRSSVVALALGQDARMRLKRALFLDRWATPLWMGLHWLLIVRSCVGRMMVWRGIAYRLDGPQRVERLNHPQNR